jgi:hypothetical protein
VRKALTVVPLVKFLVPADKLVEKNTEIFVALSGQPMGRSSSTSRAPWISRAAGNVYQKHYPAVLRRIESL